MKLETLTDYLHDVADGDVAGDQVLAMVEYGQIALALIALNDDWDLVRLLALYLLYHSHAFSQVLSFLEGGHVAVGR